MKNFFFEVQSYSKSRNGQSIVAQADDFGDDRLDALQFLRNNLFQRKVISVVLDISDGYLNSKISIAKYRGKFFVSTAPARGSFKFVTADELDSFVNYLVDEICDSLFRDSNRDFFDFHSREIAIC